MPGPEQSHDAVLFSLLSRSALKMVHQCPARRAEVVGAQVDLRQPRADRGGRSSRFWLDFASHQSCRAWAVAERHRDKIRSDVAGVVYESHESHQFLCARRCASENNGLGADAEATLREIEKGRPSLTLTLKLHEGFTEQWVRGPERWPGGVGCGGRGRGVSSA